MTGRYLVFTHQLDDVSCRLLTHQYLVTLDEEEHIEEERSAAIWSAMQQSNVVAKDETITQVVHTASIVARNDDRKVIYLFSWEAGQL